MDMSMSGMDMSMGSMSMGNGIPPLLDFPKIYWAVIGATVAVAALVNLINIIIYRQRLSAARNAQQTPAKPKSWFFRANATATAIVREAANATLDPIRIWKFNVRMPTVGRVSLVVANITVLMVLCFVGFPNTQDRAQLENIGYRTGFVCMAQLPLLFLLAGKNNIIGFLTGVSYERLNWLHRWASRCLLLTVTIHFGYWLTDWWPYGSFVSQKIRTDPITWRGLVAWCVLVWIVFSSMSPIRGWNYEFFIIQHLVSFAVFIGFVMIHTPPEVHVYIWIPVGLFFFDRIVRALYVVYTNISFFHPKQRREGNMKGLWACRGEFTPMPNDTTRITIRNPPINWSPGQHVFVSCHSVVPLQSHPFTISSIPADGKMEFYVKAEKGGTRRFFRHAEKGHGLPTSDGVEMRSIAIEGPFGRIRPLRQFDSVILFAGSTGATFTIPLLRDIVAGWQQKDGKGSWLRPSGVATRHVRFVWVIKSRGQLSWFASQLSTVVSDVAKLRSEGLDVDVEMSVYCTCDPSFTEEHKSFLSSLGTPAAPQEKNIGHGKVEEIDRISQSTIDEKTEIKRISEEADRYSIHEVDSRTTSHNENRQDEQEEKPAECCCCTTTIEDEGAISTGEDGPSACTCGASKAPNNRQTSLLATNKKMSLLDPRISLFAGRPTPRTIMRKTLEEALGESAVVVCGPQGLVDGVRNAVVRLSDERAVHKGTGAQGIYLHCEAFSY